MPHFLITGAPVPPRHEGTPKRLEINDFVKDEKMFSLYIQALTAASKEDQSKLTSFFQLAGIHGLPYVPWDGAGSSGPGGEVSTGYCSHGTTLFPTWHRPYVVLFEQVLQSHAVAIANTYTVNTAAWKDAADNLRQPYWDWAKTILPPAEVISLEKVTITNPDGQRTQVDNPLLRYHFQTKEPSFSGSYFSEWPTTLRCPPSKDANATSDVATMMRKLSDEQENIRTNTFMMLTRVHEWPDFSKHTAGQRQSVANSLEGIHDSIHSLVGGDGHMGNPLVAGFDPIFFLHHANVDRMLSLWSALNPGIWVTPDEEKDGTFTVPNGARIDDQTPLTPFWNSQEWFWTSAQSVSTERFGYSYPEFEGLDMNDPAAVQARIAEIVDELYSSTSHLPIHSPHTKRPLHPQVSMPPYIIDVQNLPVAPSTTSEGAAPSYNDTIWEWSARIRVKQYQLGSSFAVLIFLGQPPENPDDWHASNAYCGSFHTFVNSDRARCANCKGQEALVVEGFVHLQTSIAKHSGLGTFAPAHVVPYLTEKLQWRIQKLDGTVVPVEDCKSLEVTVAAVPLTLPLGARFPDAGNAVYHHNITRGKLGGAPTGSAN